MSSEARDNKRREVYSQYLPHKKDKCEECGALDGFWAGDYWVKKKRLTVHHIDGNIENNMPENLKTLCRKCHTEKHRQT